MAITLCTNYSELSLFTMLHNRLTTIAKEILDQSLFTRFQNERRHSFQLSSRL